MYKKKWIRELGEHTEKYKCRLSTDAALNWEVTDTMNKTLYMSLSPQIILNYGTNEYWEHFGNTKFQFQVENSN